MEDLLKNKTDIYEDESIDLLNDLIAIPCLKGVKNDSIIDYLEKKLLAIDCNPEVFVADSNKFYDLVEHCPEVIGAEKSQKYISGMIKGTGGGKSLLIYSHLDTMDISDHNLWLSDPLKLVNRDRKLYGLGAADAKSAIAICVMSLSIIKKLGIQLKGDVKFIAENEKDYGATGPLEVFTKGCECDSALYIHAPETGNSLGETKVRAHGMFTFRITVFGETTELNEPGYNPTNYKNIKNGTNAITKSLKVLNALYEYSNKRDKLYNDNIDFEKTIFNIGVIKGGTAPGIIPESCVIEGNIFFDTDETVNSIYDDVNSLIQELVKGDKDFEKLPPKLELFGKKSNPANIYTLKKGTAIIDTIKDALLLEKNCEYSTLSKHPGSAIRFPMIFDDTPTIGFGPLAGNFSKPNEWVSLDEYMKCIKVVVNMIYDWCK
jgi:acetylornithine deacetylase